ncbi:MAG: hypothetical protein B6I20_11300 [Bacteroidetes bacterium 4572_117]|nr:MAG: hypothetical protein B6I20_11300 [Bacteroidetes bacterium 4572_117]
MFKETTKNQRMIAAVVAVAIGLYLMIIAPTQAMITLKLALHAVMERLIPFDPDFYTAVPILGATFGIWMILIVFGGALLLVIAYSIYKGKLEARATGMGVSAIASVAGMTMFIPWMVLIVADYSQGPVPGISPPDADVTKIPPVLWIMVVGLIGYFTFLLMDKDELKNKIYKTIIYTGIGVVAGMVFMNAQHGVRYFEFIPEYLNETENLDRHDNPYGNKYTNLDYYDAHALTTISQTQMDVIKADEAVDIVQKDKTVQSIVVKKSTPVYNPNTIALFLGGYGNYISSFLMIFMVPFVFLRKRWAYNTLLMATLLSMVATYWNALVRGSFEWVIGGTMSLGLLIFLLLPVFKQFLVNPEED